MRRSSRLSFLLLSLVFLAGAPGFMKAQQGGGSVVTAASDDLSSLGMKVGVTIIFDTSGSMQDKNKLVMAKRAFNWWLESAPTGTIRQWSLYVFDAQSQKPKVLLDRRAASVEELKRTIQGLQAGGGTPLARTLEAVINVVDAENTKAAEGKGDILRQVVLVFTDGKDSYVKEREVQKLVQRLRDVGSEVFSIGYQEEGAYLSKTSDKFIMVGDERQLKEGLSSFNYFIEKSSGSAK